jgi:putative membrane protein
VPADRRRDRNHNDSRLVTLAVRFGANAAALWLASELVRGFEIQGWESILATAAIFGVVNALITPVAQLLGCALSCLTLGFFVLVINAAMLGLSVWIADVLGGDVEIDGVIGIFLAALLVSAVSWALNTFAGAPIRRALR